MPHGGWVIGVIPLRRIIESLPLPSAHRPDQRIRLIDLRGLVVYDSSRGANLGQPYRFEWSPDRLDANIAGPIFVGGDVWTIELSADRDAILQPLNHIIWLAMALMLTGLVCGGLLIWWLSNSLSRPLHLLAKDVQDLSHGGWRTADPVEPLGAWAEVHTLHREIARMTTHLRRQFADLTLAQSNLARKEEQLRLAMESSGVGLWDWEVALNRVTYSVTWRSMLGYPHESLTSGVEAWSDLVHPEDKPGDTTSESTPTCE